VKTNSPQIAKIKESVETGKPLQWVKVHKVPDYAYFNHSVHVNSGVSCVSCHGKINEMPVVFQDQSQSMGWCLDCHRAPENHLRPLDKVTNLNWTAKDAGREQKEMGEKLKAAWKINPPENCAGCHR
jgi:formate-dependent nitrite reductase cytochrome c552 subunit